MQARGYDDLFAQTLPCPGDTHVGLVEPEVLSAALVASVLALLGEGAEARLLQTQTVAQRLADLC
jgi:hypothetical protein